MNCRGTVLIVEDNAPLREMCRRHVLRKNYAVLLAVSGEEVIQIAQEQTPDIILLDMNLPSKSGWTVAKELKSNPSTNLTPIIAITAHAMRGDRERALQAGCNDFISKPIDFSILFQKMDALLPE